MKHRARGSTDIMAGADSAFAIQKEKGQLIKVVHIKSRAAEEVGEFKVSFDCEGQDGPAQFTLEKAPQISVSSPHNETDGFALLDKFFNGKEFENVRTKEIKQFLMDQNIAERSAERIWKAYQKAGHVEKVKHGYWRKPEPPMAA